LHGLGKSGILHGMNFAFTEEQEELRSTVRAFLEAKSAEEAVREQMETEDGYDPAVWSQMAEQMGLQGLHIPEEYGGSGFSYVELGIVLEEMGRALLCAPFFSSVVLAANTLIQSGDDDAKKAHLPGIASGETIATLAYVEPSGKWDESGITATATPSGDGYTISGTKSFVLDGHTANLIIVAANRPVLEAAAAVLLRDETLDEDAVRSLMAGARLPTAPPVALSTMQ
jgi:alkylation response protein AidB-like acyl-CoA dehydrogenase